VEDDYSVRKIKEVVIQADYCTRNNLTKQPDIMKSSGYLKSSLGYFEPESENESSVADALEEFAFAIFEYIKIRDGADYLSSSFSQRALLKTPDRKPRKSVKRSVLKRSESNPSKNL